MAPTTAERLISALSSAGVETVFGVPGGAILPTYDALYGSAIAHIHARTEQGAGHMAEGYAISSGKLGVVLATSGPGVTNLITPLMNALADSTPILAITGQVAEPSIGTNAFQEAPTIELTRPCTKRNWQVSSIDDIEAVVAEAISTALSGRPGPVLVDIPKDVQARRADPVAWSPGFPESGNVLDEETIRRHCRTAAEMLASAHCPVLYVGGGAIASGASYEIRQLAELAHAPVVTTLMGRGALPDAHPLALGMPGMHGSYAATTSMQQADLLVAIGARFDDRVTADPSTFAPHAQVVHIDIDANELGKIRDAEIKIHADARYALRLILEEWGDRTAVDHAAWLSQVNHWRSVHPLTYVQDADGPLKPQFVIEALHQVFGDAAIVVSGVGRHQMWTSQFWPFSRPRQWINSGGLGTMGFAVPAAIGAQVASPSTPVLAIDGDGCFEMTCNELITAAAYSLPITVAVLNNGSYGMVEQWQDLFYQGRRIAVDLGGGHRDYARIARSFGCVGLTVSHQSEVQAACRQARDANAPVLIDFKVDPGEQLWPMVVAGGSNDHIALGPDDLSPM